MTQLLGALVFISFSGFNGTWWQIRVCCDSCLHWMTALECKEQRWKRGNGTDWGTGNGHSSKGGKEGGRAPCNVHIRCGAPPEAFSLRAARERGGASIHDIRTEGEGVTKSRCMEVTVDLIPNAYREKGTKIQRQFAYVCAKWTTPADISLFILMEQMCNQKKATYHDAFSQNIAPQICSIRYLESRSERREEKIYGLRLFAEQSDLGELGVSEPKILESKVTR